MKKYIISLDQGTTSTRAILFNEKVEVCKIAQKELKVYFPEKGWVEQDANQIIKDSIAVIEEVMTDNVSAIGISNQRETTVLWNKKTGKPVYPAIVWQDRRTADYCKILQTDLIEKTGLVLDPYFSATKVSWILDNVEGVRKLAEKGEIAFGTIDSFLIWSLTKGNHFTDITNASRTLLYDIYEKKWSDELLKLFNIPISILPEVKPSLSNFGTFKKFNVPILGVLGDQQAAAFGQACISPSMVKSTYGTGCFMLLNTGEKIVKSKQKLLTTIAYQIGDEISYALEGSIFMAGAIVQWLRDNLGIISKSSECEEIASSLTSNHGVYCIPAFTGLGAPHWLPNARAAILGLTRGSNKSHIVRAALEAVAYQTKDLLLAMEKDTKSTIKTLRVDGGMIKNNWFLQFMADILRIEIDVPVNTEITAQGVAVLSALNLGIITSIDDVKESWILHKRSIAKQSEDFSKNSYEGWLKAVDGIKKMYS